MKPKRIQRKRTKGFKLETDNPLGYVLIHRPFPLANIFDWTLEPLMVGDSPEDPRKIVQRLFKQWLLGLGEFAEIEYQQARLAYLAELEKHRGKDVVCFCKLDQACHGDVILWYWEETK